MLTLEKTESINNTVCGTSFYMAPEIRDEEENGLPADCWSFAMLVGSIVGLESICPTNQKKSKFFKDCATS